VEVNPALADEILRASRQQLLQAIKAETDRVTM